MKVGRQRIYPVHYAPGKKLFHVLVRLSDAPGSYSSILEPLSKRLNLIGTITYALGDGSAIFSGFSEALSPSETSQGLKDLILRSKAAMEAEVHEGREGLLVDTFHTGFVVGSDDFMLLRRGGMTNMLDRVSKILGSGGEALLYEEGMALGVWAAQTMEKTMGLDLVRTYAGTLNKFLTAQGFGEIEGKDGPGEGEITVTIGDCFECSGQKRVRSGCNFMRGYLSGAASRTYELDFDVRETKCVYRGAKVCEFHLLPRKKTPFPTQV